MESSRRCLLAILCTLGQITLGEGKASGDDLAPKPHEQQLPHAMHSAMSERATITVGRSNADLIGADHRALQAAVDYVAALGGGTAEIGPGEYLMGDSLHLRTGVTVRGTAGETILRKAPATVSRLALDGDFGEQQVTVEDPDGFPVGAGVAVWDKNAGGFHTTVARITGRNGNTFAIDHPLMADCMVAGGATAATVFPVISGSEIQSARIENLVIEGNRSENPHLNGCRGAGIYLYRAFETAIRNCVVRNYNGDGISFQQSNDVTVEECVSEGNASLGLHPGSGSQRPVVRNCLAKGNGEDGLFLCWRVRHGLFEGNRLEGNGRFGISIGHKDSDNLLRGNHVLSNASNGVFFREESAAMSPHRNRLTANVIENNGRESETAGIRIRGEPDGLIFEENVVRDTRAGADRTQTVGILVEEGVGAVELAGNEIEAIVLLDDRRAESADAVEPNTLSDEEQQAGFRLLFDGRTTDGWRGYKREEMPPGWKVIDGILTRVAGGSGGRGAGGGDDIITKEQFDDFELRLQWRVGKGVNSGILYRVTENAVTSWHVAPEMQVLDNAGWGESERRHHAGALYDLYAPAKDTTRPLSEWNDVRLVVKGNHVEHWLNGEKVVECEIGSDDWNQRVAGSKFKDKPDFAKAARGHICLQDHSGRIEYRNIKIRDLSEGAGNGKSVN